MAGAKEIRTKIKSIKNMQKITRAMEMVAASKMRKTQERMRASRPYAEKIANVIEHLAQSNAEYRHPYLEKREIKNIGVIIISTDRGLCGGLNAFLFRETLKSLQQWQQQNIGINLALVGRKAEAFFKRVGGNILGITTHLGDTPSLHDLVGVVKIMCDAYNEGKIDALYVAYNEFVSTMSQKPKLQQLIPLPVAEENEMAHHWDYIYEPDAKELLTLLLDRYMESEVYQAVVENIACEQAAKMIAMKSASDNAGEIIKEFQLAYNKARQSAITQELAEIVGGAAAL